MEEKVEKRTDRRRRWIWLAAVLLVILAAAGLYWCLSELHGASAVAAPWSESPFVRRYFSWRCFGNWKAWASLGSVGP